MQLEMLIIWFISIKTLAIGDNSYYINLWKFCASVSVLLFFYFCMWTERVELLETVIVLFALFSI